VTIVRVTDEATREQIATAIAALKTKHDRLPAHFEAKRAEIMDEIDALVDEWLAAGPNCRTCGRTKASCDAEPRACCEVCRANGHGE
jgi:hypothetical protein